MIKFKNSELAATKDRTTLSGWEKHAILSSTAAKEIARNNDLDPEIIDIEEFERTAKRLGYRREK